MAKPTLERVKSSGQNYHGGALSDHHAERAREILREGLGAEPLARLSQLRKSDPLKVRLATRIRQETTLPLRWIANELHIGTPMNVSRLTRMWPLLKYSSFLTLHALMQTKHETK